MANQEQKINILTNLFGIFQKSVDWSKKYSFIDMLKGLFALVVSTAVLFIFLNPSYFLERYEQFKDKKHTEEVDKRLEISPKIQIILDKLLLTTKANRAYIIEFHNGTNNLNGLPFLFGDMTYEEVSNDDLEYISELYQNVPLSRFSISQKLFEDGFWYGTVDELANIDKRLASRIKINNGSWIALILLKGQEHYLGVIGVSYTDSAQVKKEVVGKQLRTAAINTISLIDK
jgi:hypothetical protein